jgi:hypothetical protein
MQRVDPSPFRICPDRSVLTWLSLTGLVVGILQDELLIVLLMASDIKASIES